VQIFPSPRLFTLNIALLGAECRERDVRQEGNYWTMMQRARQKKETAACVFVAARVSQLARPPKKPLCVKRLFII